MINLDLKLKYALAVSGGVDSMVMLHKFAAMSPRPNFFVVTVNHGLREQAAADCQFVADYCDKLGVSCRIVGVDVPAYCAEHKVSVETGARILRYEVLGSLDADFVCLAHNADDNAETVLMHILRGSGAKGATGIRARNGKYLRPILDMTRQQIEQYAVENSVPYVNDLTNGDTAYARNFIRHKVLPLLTELNPAAKANLLRFADNVGQDDEFIDSIADISAVVFDKGSAKVPKQLLAQPAPVAYRVLNKVFCQLGVFYDIEKTHLEQIVALAANFGGKSVNLPFNLVATNDYDCITIRQNEATMAQSFEIPFAVGTIQTPLGVVEVSTEPSDGALRFDLNKLPKNCVFRTKRQGDVFTKFGGGTKPLRKYLIDRKIPSRQRDSLLLVASGNEILVICGVEIADSVKLDDGVQPYYIKARTL